MSGLVLPTVRVAAVQAAPVFLILNPQGQAIAGPLLGRAGILYADCDLGQEIVAKQAHDIVGTYQRSDIFQLLVDTRRHTPLRAGPGAGRDQ